MATELYDEWANEAEALPPAVSWKYSDVGDPATDTVRGVIVPPSPLDEPAKGYAIRADSNKEGKRVWPPKAPWVHTPKPGAKPNTPISESEYLAITGGDDSAMREVAITVLVLQTEYRNMEFFSGPQRALARETQDFVDDGLRAFFIDGKDVPPKFKVAVKKLRTAGPQPGQVFECQIIGREPNTDKEGETNRFRIGLSAPTPESLKVVAAHVKAAQDAAEVPDPNDPWAVSPDVETEKAPTQPEEAPF